jgi:hypothetical protein
MRYFKLLSILLIAVLFSCNDDNQQRIIAQQKEQKKSEQIFNTINGAWQFKSLALHPKAEATVKSWVTWQQFLDELYKKPKASLGSFQNKSKELSKKAALYREGIPPFFDKPEIRTRLVVLQTKINGLELFINLNQIPEQKVIAIIEDINLEIVALQNQFNELIKKSEIPIEEGEADSMRMLDTARAIPTVK